MSGWRRCQRSTCPSVLICRPATATPSVAVRFFWQPQVRQGVRHSSPPPPQPCAIRVCCKAGLDQQDGYTLTEWGVGGDPQPFSVAPAIVRGLCDLTMRRAAGRTHKVHVANCWAATASCPALRAAKRAARPTHVQATVICGTHVQWCNTVDARVQAPGRVSPVVRTPRWLQVLVRRQADVTACHPLDAMPSCTGSMN